MVWKLKKTLYGLGDAPRSWYLRVHRELLKLGCTRMTLDPALYVIRGEDGVLHGALAVHVDDFSPVNVGRYYRTGAGRL